MSYSGGSGGNGGYDRRGSGGSAGYGGGSSGTGGGGGYNEGSGSGYDQRSGTGGYDQRGGASGGYDQRGGSGGGYDQYGSGGGGGGGYGASGGGYDQRSSSGGYDQYRSSGGSGSTGYDQRSGSGGGGYDQRSGGSGYDDYSRGGYDSRSSSGYAAGSGQTASGYGQSSRDYASGSGGYGEYQSGSSSSRGGYDERGYDNRSSGSGGYNSGYGASASGSGGYGRGYEGTSGSSTSAGYGYKDERGGHSGGASGSGSGGGYGGGGSSSGGGYSRGYGETGSSSGGYGGSRDDRSGGGYGGGGASSYGSRGYEERGSSSYGGGGSDRGSTSGGGDRYGGSSGGGDRYGGSSTGSYDRGGGGGRDDRRGSGGGGDDRGGRGGYGGGDRDDRGGRGGYGGRGGGRGGGGGGRGGGRGEMGQGVGEVKGTGYEQVGHALQDPRLVASWTGQVPPLVVPEDHVEMHREFTVCRRPDAATNGRKIDVSINYFGVTLDTSRVQEIFKYHVAVERVHAADAKYGAGRDRAAEVKDEPMTGADQQQEGAGGGDVKLESGEDVEMTSAEAPPRGDGGEGGGRDRGREERKLSKQVVRMVINEALRAHEADFGGVKVAHDSMSAIYSPVRLPWTHRVFENINPNGPQAPHANQREPLPRGRGPPTFDVTIKEVESIPVTDLDAYYGNADHNPMRLIQALDVVARHLGAQRMIPVGRNLFSVKKTHPLQGGKELCWGYHQSIRIGQRKLLLNIDQAATVFYAPESLLTLAMACVRARSPQDMERLDERQLRMLARALRKIEVVPNHRTDRKRPIQTVSNTSADALMFDMRDGSSKSVAQYFREKYGAASLKYPFLPAVNVGSKQRANWLPLEVCDVAPGQRCANINELDTAEIIRKTCQKPRDRQRIVMDQVHSAGFENDPYLHAFGLRVDQRMETVAARVLETPEVQYKNVSERPHQGAWNLRDKEFVDGAALENWGVVVEGGVGLPRSQVDNFVTQFCRTARICGMDVRDSSPVFLDGSDRRGASIEELMLECFREIERKGRGAPKLIMVVKRDASVGSYGEIKRVSDTVLGVPSQCIVAKNVPKANPQYCANVCLKVNMKLSGKNSILRDKFPLVSDVPTIIIGADVQHPRSGMGSRPSIASVVASLDKYSAKYVGRVASQKGNDIQKLPGMLRDLFLAYYQHTGRKPERVIYYRDGVSEGQFHDILQSEMHALRQAALMLEDSYLPPVTFIITNKRHHMRAFSDHNQNLDRSGNIVPGTVIDAGIVDSHRFDFFLYGHSGIQGTSCPAHYTVLHDENKLSSDEIQRLTYNLCYTYQRCTRSVSVVPPVYYAHLAAARAKFFLNEGSDGASTIGSYNSNSSSFEFAELHKNMLNCMFFV